MEQICAFSNVTLNCRSGERNMPPIRATRQALFTAAGLSILLISVPTPSRMANAQDTGRPSVSTTISWLREQNLTVGSPGFNGVVGGTIRRMTGRHDYGRLWVFAPVWHIAVDHNCHLVVSGTLEPEPRNGEGRGQARFRIDLRYAAVNERPLEPGVAGLVSIGVTEMGHMEHVWGQIDWTYAGDEINWDDTHTQRRGEGYTASSLYVAYVASVRANSTRLHRAFSNLISYCPRPTNNEPF